MCRKYIPFVESVDLGDEMNYTYKTLCKDLDFLTAAVTQVRVSVWLVLKDHEVIIDYGGVLGAYSDVSVKIAGNRYFRDKFEFRAERGR